MHTVRYASFAKTANRYLVPILSIALTIPAASAADTKVASPHVLTLDEVRQDIAKQSADRQANDKVIDDFFALPRVQKTLTVSGVNADRLRHSVALLDDKDQAALAARASSATQEIAGGDLTEAQVTLVILAAIGFAFLTVLVLAFK